MIFPFQCTYNFNAFQTSTRVILILTCVDGNRIYRTILTGLETQDVPPRSILVPVATILTVRMVCSSSFPSGGWYACLLFAIL